MIDLLNLVSRKTAIIDSPSGGPPHRPTHLSHKHMKTIVQFLRSVACLCFINHFGELLLAPFAIPRKSSPLYCLQTFWAALKFLGIG